MNQQNIAMEEGSLRSAANVTRMAKQNFNREGNVLMNEIRGMQNGWVGEGGKAFQTLAQEWNEKQERISRLLETLADQLDKTEQDSMVNDSEVASEIQKQASSFNAGNL